MLISPLCHTVIIDMPDAVARFDMIFRVRCFIYAIFSLLPPFTRRHDAIDDYAYFASPMPFYAIDATDISVIYFALLAPLIRFFLLFSPFLITPVFRHAACRQRFLALDCHALMLPPAVSLMLFTPCHTAMPERCYAATRFFTFACSPYMPPC